MNWQLNTSLLCLRAQVNALAPKRLKGADGAIGDAAHSARASDHNPDKYGIVNAIDITHDPEHGCDAGKIAESLRVSQDSRIKYVIFNGRMFSSYAAHGVAPWTWRPYTGASAHEHHVHISAVGSEKKWSI